MNIRKATIEDLELLVPLFNGYRVFYKQTSDLEGARHFLRERFQNKESVIYIATSAAPDRAKDSPDFVKAEEEEIPIGFTQLYPIFSSVSMERMFMLNDLYIDPDYRGQGVGKALIDTVKELCRATHQKGIALQTETTNPAQRLYEREGFTIDKDLQYFWTNI